MKLSIITLFLLLQTYVRCQDLAEMRSPEGVHGDGSFLFSRTEVLLACTASSQVRMKLEAALEACYQESSNGVFNRRRKRCSSVEQIEQKVVQDMEAEVCILKEIGWVDGGLNIFNETISNDMMSLPEEVTDSITNEAIAICAKKKIKKFYNKYRNERCKSRYTEEDMARLDELGNNVSSFECFEEYFTSSCQYYVKTKIEEIFQDQIDAAAKNQ